MSAPSAISYKVVGCLLMAGLPVLWLIGGGTRSASCSSALNSRSPDASLSDLDGSFQEWCCGFDGRSWRFWAVGWSAVMRRFLAVVLAWGLVRTRGRGRMEGFARTRRFTIHIRGRRPIDADFLWLPPRTPGTIEASERALSAAPTASAKAPRSALA